MKKTAISIICVCLCAVMLAGCSGMPFFNSSDIENLLGDIENAGKLIGSGGRTVVVVEQTKVIDYTVDFPKGYYKLNSNQQRIYRIILTAAQDMVEGWISLGEKTKGFENDAALAYRAFTYDYPEIFWLPSYYFVSSREDGSSEEALITFSYDDGENRCDYLVKKDQRDKMKAELDAAVKAYVKAAENRKDSFEKELYVHDRLCQETEYDENGGTYIYTAYGALVEGIAVCEGYSRAMQLICNELRIPCVLVYGESKGEGHMWNLINPGDGWYHLDVTWDDDEELIYTYFNITKSDITADHIIEKTYDEAGVDVSKTSVCYNFFDYESNGEFFNYYNYTRAVLKPDFEDAVQKIGEANSRGDTEVCLKVTDSDLLSEFEGDYNVPAARLQDKLYEEYGDNAPVLSAISSEDRLVTLYWD